MPARKQRIPLDTIRNLRLRNPTLVSQGPVFDPAPTGEFREIAVYAYDGNPNVFMPDRIVFPPGVSLADSVEAAVARLSQVNYWTPQYRKVRGRRVPVIDRKTKRQKKRLVRSQPIRPTRIGGLISLDMSESDEEAIMSVTLDFLDPDRFALALLQPGVWFSVFYVDKRGNAFEWIRAMVWEHSATDRKQARTSITATDVLGRLHKYGKEDMIYKKDSAHKTGWTAKDVAKRVCDLVGVKPEIPYTSGYRFTYLKCDQSTPYEQLIKAFSLDTQRTGLRWRIRSEGGRVVVALRAVRKDTSLFNIRIRRPEAHDIEQMDKSEAYMRQITSDRNLESSEYRASLDGFATRLQVKAAGGFDNVGTPNAQKRFWSVNFVNAQAEKQISGDPKKGVIGPYVKQLDLENSSQIKELNDVIRVGRNHLSQLQRRTRQATIEADGNPLIRAGDAIYIEDYRTGLVGYFFCQKVSHAVQGRRHSMTVELTETVKLPEMFPSRDDVTDPTRRTGGGSGTTRTVPTGKGTTTLMGVEFVNPFLTGSYSYGDGPVAHSIGSRLVPPRESFTSQNKGGWPSNWAWDMYAPAGTSIYAPIAGTVKYVQDRGKAFPGSPGINGWTVIIESGKGLAVGLFHINKPNLKVGDTVTIGQRISSVAEWKSPKVGNPHLHLSAGPSWASQAIAANKPSQYAFKNALDQSQGKSLPTQPDPSPSNPPADDGTTSPTGKAAKLSDRIDKFIEDYRSDNPPMRGLGDSFVKWGIKYGIDPTFVVANSKWESQMGRALPWMKRRDQEGYNNPFGQTTGQKTSDGKQIFANYTSFDAAIQDVMRRLASATYAGIPNTPSGILGRYAPYAGSADYNSRIADMKRMGSRANKVRGWKISDWGG